MSAKSVFLIVVTILITIILMKNTDEVNFWLFGDIRVSKLAILAAMFLIGFITGALSLRPRKKKEIHEEEKSHPEEKKAELTDEDRNYIS